MLLRAIKAEVLKCRRAPVWLAFLVLPVFPAVLGTFNYLGNLGVLEDQWYSLWSQHTLFSSMFFLPALFGVFCAWQWRLEHTDHNWNAVLTAPVPAGTLYLAKLAVDAAVSLLAMAFIGVLFVLSGKVAGITAPLPPEKREEVRDYGRELLNITGAEMAAAYELLELKRFKGILDNIVYLGLQQSIDRVFNRAGGKKPGEEEKKTEYPAGRPLL